MSRFINRAVLVLCLFLSFSAVAQTPVIQNEGYDFQSPYHALETFINAFDDDNYHPEIAAKAFIRKGIDGKEAQEVAIKLNQVLLGNGIDIKLNEIPDNPHYIDTVTNRARYVLVSRYPDIYLEKIQGHWIFAKESIVRIHELHAETYPFGTAKLLNLLPKIGNKLIMGLHTWQYVGILILVLLSLVVHKIFTFIFEHVILRIIRKIGYKDLAINYVLPVARPFSIVVILLLQKLFIPVLQLPVFFSKYLLLGITLAVPLFGTVVFYRLADILALYLEKLATKTESTLDDQLIPLLRRTLKIFVIVIGTLFCLQSLDFDITTILAGISIGGLAFALAAQDTIKNFLGSIMIFLDKPFQIGHWITSGSEIDGTVEEVGFRSTRIRTTRNSVTYVPNAKLADAVVDNNGLRVYRRFLVNIGVTYDTPPQKIEEFVEGLRKIAHEHPDTRKDFIEVHFNEMGDSALKILFYTYFTVGTLPEEYSAKQDILLKIMRLAESLSIRFAYPTQTLHIETMPGQPSLTPPFDLKKN